MSLIKYFSTGFLAIVIYFTYDIYLNLTMESIFDNYNQSDFTYCTRVTEILGCEDLVIHSNSGYAFAGCPKDYLTHTDFFGENKDYDPEDSKQGSYFVSYDVDNRKAVQLTTKGIPPHVYFEILGIDLIEDDHDPTLVHLLAVNRRGNGTDSVVHFTHTLGSSEITYVKSFDSDCLQFVNSIAALTPSTFYYTQFISHSTGILGKLQINGFLEGGKVLYYDGETCYRLRKGFKVANGIDLSPDKKFLYVAETIRGKLHIFRRNGIGLESPITIPLGFLPDNLHVDPHTGYIYLAGFSPHFREGLKLATYDGIHHTDPEKSIVARVILEETTGPELTYTIEPLMVDQDGDTLFSTTAGVVDSQRNILLMSGLFTNQGMLDCRLSLD